MGANEKHAATYHGGEYDFGSPDVVTAKRVKYMSDSEFNLWLDKIRAEAKAEALNEAAAALDEKAERLIPEDSFQQGARIGLITASTDLANRANQYKEEQ